MKNALYLTSFLVFLAGCISHSSSSGAATKSKSISAGEESLYECYRMKKPPVLDGNLDDECWRFIPEAKCFFVLGGTEFAIVKPSFFKAGWDDDNFYLGFFAYEPETQKIVARRLDGDNFLWAEDSVELFLTPSPEYTWQFIANAIGSRWNGDGVKGTGRPLENWQAKSYIGKDFWSVEVKIPFKIVGKVPSDGEKWKINVGRNNLTGPAEERVSSWPRIKKSFHEIENYGTIVFKNSLLNSETVKIREEIINGFRYNMLKNIIATLAESYNTEYKKCLEKALSVASLSAQADQLVKTWVFVVGYYEKMKKEKGINLNEIYEVLQKTKGIKEKTEEIKQKVEIESLFD